MAGGCVVFEGRDTAGKGGTIKTLTDRAIPRVFRVVALPASSEREKSQVYVQRYLSHFPAAGEVKLPRGQKPGGYREPDYPFRFIPTPF